MPIKIQGNLVVAAPQEEVYRLLLDPAWMKGVMNRIPGITVESLEQISETEYDGVVSIGVSAIKGTYNGKITVLEHEPSDRIKLRAEAKGGGNWTNGDVELSLTPQGHQTALNYVGEGNINGPLASIGQRLVDVVGRQFIDQGARVFAQEIEEQHRARTAPAGVQAVPPPPAPPPRPSWIVPASAAALFILLALAVYLLYLR